MSQYLVNSYSQIANKLLGDVASLSAALAEANDISVSRQRELEAAQTNISQLAEKLAAADSNEIKLLETLAAAQSEAALQRSLCEAAIARENDLLSRLNAKQASDELRENLASQGVQPERPWPRRHDHHSKAFDPQKTRS